MYTLEMNDLFGKALLDYHNGNYSEDIVTATNISEEDLLPLPYLFRDYEAMPTLEQQALQHCKGKVLDVGCGAGSHAIWLQENDHAVCAIDISEGAIQVAKERGAKQAICSNVLAISEETFDTILLLMNGTGIFETIDKTPHYLRHLKNMLNGNGQILIDSSDLQYMYDRNEDGSIWVPSDHYYGELTFSMSYKGATTATFPWLYLDEQRFENLAIAEGFTFEVLARGAHFDYLARLTVVDDTP